jgi:hypothetical protein
MSTQNASAVAITGGNIIANSGIFQTLQAGTSATPALFITSAGNVGIGTTAPSQKFEISGNILAVGSGSSWFGSNVGIGTTAPAALLDVAGAVTASTGTFTTLKTANYALPAATGALGQMLITDLTGTLIWANTSAGVGGVTSVTAEKPLASSGGATPNITLSVDNKTIGTIVGGALSIKAGSGTSGQMLLSTGTSTTWANTGPFSQWTTKGASISYIAGNVGIGMTTPKAPLHITQPTNDVGNFPVQRWDFAGEDNYSLQLTQHVTGGLVVWGFDNINNGTAYSSVLTINQGNVGIGTTAPAAKFDVAGAVIATTGTFTTLKTANYALPAATGALGQMLITDLTGTLIWANTSAGGAGVTSVTAEKPIASSGGATPNITLSVDNKTIGTIVGGALSIKAGSGVDGQMLISTGTGTIWANTSVGGSVSQWTTVGSNLAYMGGNVGIGNTTPGKILMVGSNVDTSQGIIRFAHKTGGNNRRWDIGTGDGVNFGSVDNFGVFDLGMSAGALVIERTSGEVGIGTTNPSSLLHVAGAVTATTGTFTTLKTANYALPAATGTNGQMLITNLSGTLIWANTSAGTGSSQWTTAGSDIYYNSGNVGVGTTTPLGLLQIGTSAAPGLLVTSNGNVGLGTTNPTSKLDVAVGDVSVASGEQYNFEGSSGDSYMKYDSSGNCVSVYVNGAEVMRLR